MTIQPIWIAGDWSPSSEAATFHATNPISGEASEGIFPISTWADCNAALNAAVEAAQELRHVSGDELAKFLDGYAAVIERRAGELVEVAHAETGLPVAPRLRDVELIRTTTQLRQGAVAARDGSWQRVVIDTANKIRSHFAPSGPVVIFGPNNFPFAFNPIAGGDLTAAVAAGCPVIAKGHPLHPATTEMLAQCAREALSATKLPKATVQLLYHVGNEDGLRLVSDPRVGAVSFTGSRMGGMRLKEAAERSGRPIYLEMSSLNPVVILPGALQERAQQIAEEFADSALAAGGQFCTSPNLVLVIGQTEANGFAEEVARIYQSRIPAVLLSREGLESLERSVQAVVSAGAQVRLGAKRCVSGNRYENTLLQATGEEFLKAGSSMQVEAFGNSSLLIAAHDKEELREILAALEGNLTGCIYSSNAGDDDALYADIAETLRFKTGRLLNDKMPTGLALSPAMNHGGPYPSTGHPGFTAVGIPASMLRFAALHCYDNVREARLPPALKNHAPNDSIWRSVDGAWIQGDVP
jgi:2,5-dioxopentanoate dehydrogenase